MSNRRALALSQLLELHRIDNVTPSGRKSFNLLQPPQDFIEAEERRRTFWYIYFSDRWVGAGAGRTSSIKNEEVSSKHLVEAHQLTRLKITTLMPASECAFRDGQPEIAQSLQCATSNGLEQSAAPMVAAVVSAWILEKCTIHLREASDIKDERQFWLEHQRLDNAISKILMDLPDHLRAASTRDPFAFFVNMCLHQFTISLLQGAIQLAQKSPSRYDTVARLRVRARRAAEEIVNIMRAEAYMDVRRVGRSGLHEFVLLTLADVSLRSFMSLRGGYCIHQRPEVWVRG